MNNETLILINEEDLADGFFRFGTSLQRERDRFVRRLGVENIVSERKDHDENGKVGWWDLRCKKERLARATGILKSKKVSLRPWTSEQRREQSLKMKKMRAEMKKRANAPKN